MTSHELLDLLIRLRRANISGVRAPHKPLLLLWLFGRFAMTGTTAVTYAEAEEPVSRLINDFGPPVASTSRSAQRAAMPFVHLERELWQLRDSSGREIGPDAPEAGAWLRRQNAVGQLHSEVEQLLSNPDVLATAARSLLDHHFTPALAGLIAHAVSLDLPALGAAAMPRLPSAATSLRQPGFAEDVLRAYAYACAMCGFDGALGRTPVGVDAAHVRWRSQNGPDEMANGVALCALHHRLLDLGVLGLTEDLHVRVSDLYVARSEAGTAVDGLAGRPLSGPRPGQPTVAPVYVAWHGRQVFKTRTRAK